MSWPLNQNIEQFIQSHLTSDMRVNGALDLSKFAEKIGIKSIELAEFNDDSISGLLQRSDDDWKIYVNFTDSPRRRRFTIAHEIGHYISYVNNGLSRNLLDREGKITDFAFTRNGEFSRVEAEANAIAAKILMPENDIRDMVERDMTVEEIAGHFKVSEIAASVRLRDLNITPFESYGWESGRTE